MVAPLSASGLAVRDFMLLRQYSKSYLSASGPAFSDGASFCKTAETKEISKTTEKTYFVALRPSQQHPNGANVWSENHVFEKQKKYTYKCNK